MRLVVFLLGNQLLLQHGLEHQIGSALDGLRRAPARALVIAAAGIVAVGISDNGGDGGAFAQRQILKILAEVVLRGDLHAVAGAAEEDDVHVSLENLLLGETLLDLHGEIGLLHLAAIGLLAAEHGQLDQLAGERGRALGAAAHEVVDDGAHLALQVDAVVLEEALVLDGDDGVDEVLGNLVDLHVDSVLRALELRNQTALAVVDERGLGLRADLVQIQIRRGVHPRLGHAHHESAAGQADQQHDEEQHPHRHEQHRDQEIPLPLPGLENHIFCAHVFLHRGSMSARREETLPDDRIILIIA